MAVIYGDPSRPENINALAGNLQLLLIRFHLSSGVILGSENFMFFFLQNQADTGKSLKDKKMAAILDNDEKEHERQLAEREEELVMDLISKYIHDLC